MGFHDKRGFRDDKKVEEHCPRLYPNHLP